MQPQCRLGCGRSATLKVPLPGWRALLLPAESVMTNAISTCLRWPAVTTLAQTVTLQSVSRSGSVSCRGVKQCAPALCPRLVWHDHVHCTLHPFCMLGRGWQFAKSICLVSCHSWIDWKPGYCRLASGSNAHVVSALTILGCSSVPAGRNDYTQEDISTPLGLYKQ
jgi:hypothetical protein